MITLTVEGFSSNRLDRLGEILSNLSGQSGAIAIKVISEDEVRELNSRYSGENRSTDVLSFDYKEDAEVEAGSDLGDIVISYEHMQRQADAADTTVETEFLLLVTHGVLHILGYDHQDEAEKTKMDDVQADVMDRLGLPYRNFGWRN